VTHVTCARFSDRSVGRIAHLYLAGTWTVVVWPQGCVSSMCFTQVSLDHRHLGLFDSLYWAWP